MKFSKEFKVGLMTLVAGVILYLGFNFLKGADVFSHTNTFYIKYSKVDGLAPSNPVLINGYQVGKVKTLTLNQQDNNSILVSIEVNDDILVGDGTYAEIAKDLLGSMSIVLKMNKNTKLYEDGATIKGGFQMSLTDMLEGKAYPVIDHLDTTLVHVGNMLDADMRSKLYGTLANLEAITSVLKTTMQSGQSKLDGTFTNLNTLTANLVETEKKLTPVIAKFSALADSLNDMELKQTVANANLLLVELNKSATKISKGEGTLGALVNDKAAYDNLNKTLTDLDALLLNLNKNPNHFFAPFGKKEKKVK
ncbi:MAG: MlaD family protein [Cytophaga sp.]|uniref:MlaD family protein n=1 Tax=Cytophaga sp. TaxID=29535 RepID=UPI003F81C671